jgi:hypothetical protein
MALSSDDDEGSGFLWGKKTPRECATAVANAETPQRYFAWSEATSMCWSCSDRQLRRRVRNAQYTIFDVAAFVHLSPVGRSPLPKAAAVEPAHDEAADPPTPSPEDEGAPPANSPAARQARMQAARRSRGHRR